MTTVTNIPIEMERQAKWLLKILWHKPFQWTIQSLFDSNNRCEQHVQFSCFNSLNVANVQIGNFSQSLLANAVGKAFSTDVITQLFQPGRADFWSWHI